jgi:hypothetical protein
MRRSIVIFLSLLWVPLRSSYAISIALSGAATSDPFLITVPRDSLNSTDLVLTAMNETDSTLSVIGWQLRLQLLPRAGATGNLLFQSAMTAPDSLFGPDPGPISDLSEPSPQLVVTDLDTVTSTGQPIHPDMPRNILKLNLSADLNTSGVFELITPEFDPANPDDKSFWLAPEDTTPRPIANSARSDIPGSILLGTIHVTSAGTPILGDYNGDGVVDVVDYERWRAAFGTAATPPGGGADGNGNAVVDAADYVVWRNATGGVASSRGAEGTASIPEPATCLGMVLGLCLTCWKSRPCQSAARTFCGGGSLVLRRFNNARNGVSTFAEY